MEVSQPLDHVTHAVIGGAKAIDFGISNSAEFFDILSRTLYTDQILAVVREVLCNAWDAHIASGRTGTPIQITLDSEHLIVRDFGFGIRHDDIGPIYGVYGNSTKKNDGTQTGGFGLGCKAPFAYTDHFEVISHHLGTKTIYNMSKSNAVAKGKPGIITLVSMATEETGLQVKIPIKNIDRVRFHEVIRRIISNGEMRAELNGQLQPVIAFSEARHGFLMTQHDIMGSRSTDRILLRYGNVIYPIDNSDEISDLYKAVQSVLQRFRFYKLILQAPPDSISVTPSRESLSMQEHTIVTVKRLLKDFLVHAKSLDTETLNQGKQLVDASIAQKSYDRLFSSGWGFNNQKLLHEGHITDLRGMARFQLTLDYPKGIEFRRQDVDYRVRKATDAKMVDARLADSFLEVLPTVKDVPGSYSYYADHRNSNDWLSRRVLGKAMSKLIAKGLHPKSLYIFDSMQPGRGYSENKLTRATEATLRNHLLNLPYLRKVVVVTTAMTRLEERMRFYARNNADKNLPTDGLLCYYVGTRKAGSAEAAIEVFTKLGYEIIDLTKRHSWEKDDRPPPAPRGPREPYPGLPALSNILRIDNSIKTQSYREDDATKLPNPELVLVIGARDSQINLEGFSTAATKALVKLYGSRVGIAETLTAQKRAIKHGAKEFQPVLEDEITTALMQSPVMDEYYAYEYHRIRETLDWRKTDVVSLIYSDADLRKEFGLPDNRTDDQKFMTRIFRESTCLSVACQSAIDKHIATIKLGPENQKAIDAVTGNELLDMLDIGHIKSGLRGPKRQVYLDVFLKVLKG